MGNKIQGEGDYEAGRRFQKEEHDFVRRKYGKRQPSDEMDDYELDASADDADDMELGDDDDTEIADARHLQNNPNMDGDERRR